MKRTEAVVGLSSADRVVREDGTSMTPTLRAANRLTRILTPTLDATATRTMRR